MEAVYAVNKTCSHPEPWSTREVICEVNYMEVRLSGNVKLRVDLGLNGFSLQVSVKSEFPSSSGTNWNALRPVRVNDLMTFFFFIRF